MFIEQVSWNTCGNIRTLYQSGIFIRGLPEAVNNLGLIAYVADKSNRKVYVRRWLPWSYPPIALEYSIGHENMRINLKSFVIIAL